MQDFLESAVEVDTLADLIAKIDLSPSPSPNTTSRDRPLRSRSHFAASDTAAIQPAKMPGSPALPLLSPTPGRSKRSVG